jgi:hypothetical protein
MGLLFTGFLTIVMGLSIIKFGHLISNTPDMMERHGERKQKSEAPADHALYFACGFGILFIFGGFVVAYSNTTQQLILGSVVIFAELLFSCTVLFYSMQIYNLMKKNEIELKGSVVA